MFAGSWSLGSQGEAKAEAENGDEEEASSDTKEKAEKEQTEEAAEAGQAEKEQAMTAAADAAAGEGGASTEQQAAASAAEEKQELPPEATGAEDVAIKMSLGPETEAAEPPPEVKDHPETPEAAGGDEAAPEPVKVEAEAGKKAKLWQGAAARIAIRKMEPRTSVGSEGHPAQPASSGESTSSSQALAKWDDLLLLTKEVIKKPEPEEPAVVDSEEREEAARVADVSIGSAEGAVGSSGEPAMDEPVYLTDSYLEWERIYALRLAKRIHRLVCRELSRAEESLFMLYTHHDTDLNGVLSGSEAGALVEALEAVAPGAKADLPELAAEDGSVSFLSLLQWYGDSGSNKETSATFSFTSAAVGLMGSGAWACDARLDELGTASLKANVLGYRRILRQLRQHKEGQALNALHEAASEKENLLEAMPLYYAALAQEFTGDSEVLFELFNEVDESGNLLLELPEVEALLRLIDQQATEADVKRYLYEIMAEGGLTFANLVDWWEQARCVSNSLVAEKGAALLTPMKARAARSKLGGYFGTETCVMRNIRAAAEASTERLELLRDAYCRTFSEFRDYQMTKELQDLEAECAKL